VVVTGLTNGSAYRFQISATNGEGTSPYSPPSAAVTPLAAVVIVPPGAPTVEQATAGDGLVTVRWSPPASDGGSPVSGYAVRVFEGDTQVGSQSTDGDTGVVDVTGLVNGTPYSFDVSASNDAGTGAPSDRSAAVTPTAPVVAPKAPRIGVAAPRSGSATVRWTAPGDGGSAITGYTIRTFAGTTLVRTQKVPGTFASVVVSGLTNKTAYTFEVSATNRAGTSKPSARSAAVTPRAEFVLPTVTARTPAPAAKGVRRTGDVTATFSEPVTGTGTATFVLRLGGKVVPAAVSYNARTRRVTLNPTAPLAVGRTYTATLSGIRDVAGNTMAPTAWSFTSGRLR
jgi:hypothetical protein